MTLAPRYPVPSDALCAIVEECGRRLHSDHEDLVREVGGTGIEVLPGEQLHDSSFPVSVCYRTVSLVSPVDL